MCQTISVIPENFTSALPLQVKQQMTLLLPEEYVSFYVSDEPAENGWPQNGTLFDNGDFTGKNPVSIFDPVLNRSRFGLLLQSEDNCGIWKFQREGSSLKVILEKGNWNCHAYPGNEPNWNCHPFPFRNLPQNTPELQHARIRGLLDFCAATRTSEAGFHFQSPNSMIGKGYMGDGIPDTFFHFISVYDHLSEKRQKWFRKQFEWLGENIRFDGCIPWGGCRNVTPYYHIWKRSDCGLFFDGNGLWLDVMDRIAREGHEVNLETVVRAADFYLHYLSPDGLLVAAESRMRGCEWADLIQSGWKAGLINVIAVHGLECAADILRLHAETELSERYAAAARRIREHFNLPVEQGGLWMGNGFADWVTPDNTAVRTWRIDANMLAVIWNIASPEHAETLFQFFREKISKTRPAVPFPYLLTGRWDSPTDYMLEGCREFGCGTDSMPGRMGATAAAAAFRLGDQETGDRILEALTSLINNHEFLWEKYRSDGTGYGCRSYVEHAVSVMLTESLRKSSDSLPPAEHAHAM